MPQKPRSKPVIKDIEKNFYSRLLLVLIIIAVIVAIYLLWPARHGNTKTHPASDPELVLNVIPLKAKDITVTEKYIGYITPVKSVELVPKINGYLEEIWVNGGEKVTAGDKLVKIKQNEYKAQLDAAKASVVQAQADYNNAQVYFGRIKKAGAKAISKTEVDNAKAKFLAAQGALAQARANQELAQVNYDYTLLSAPISGIVGNVDLTRGQYVSPASSPLLKIIQADPIRVVFSMTDKAYLDETARNEKSLFAGENIKLRLSNGNLYAFPGQFKFTANEIDRSTSSIAVYADFKNPEYTLVANAYVDVLVERPLKEAYAIPQNYVSMTPEGNFVYTVRGDKLLKVPLKIESSVGAEYVVTNKFAPREYLVVDKIGTIPQNAKIKIKAAGTSSRPEEHK